MRYSPTTGYVLPFKKLSRFRPLRGRGVGRMRYTPTTGYLRSFEIPMKFSNRVPARVQKTDLYTPPSVAYGGAYAIRPYDRVCAILRNTDAIPQSGTYGTSKNRPVFVPFGAVCGAYSIRPYNWVRAILRNTNATPQPGTYGPSKNCLVFVPFEAVYGAYSIRPTDQIRMVLQKTFLYSPPSVTSVGRIQYAPTIGYVRFFKIPMQISNWVCAILRNTDMISRPEGREFLGGGAVGATACGGDGRE